MNRDNAVFTLHPRLELALFLVIMLVIAVVYLATFYPDQGWGDDYAQYIAQAQNLTRGISMEDTGYIYSRYTPSLGPRAYPPGFPLLLAPTIAAFGIDMRALQVEIILFQLITLAVVYLLYRREVSPPVALALLLMMGLSPYFIAFKRDIMSDVPFMLVCLGFVLWVERCYRPGQPTTRRDAAVAAVLAFLCYLVRTIGFVTLLALLVSDLLRTRRISRFTLLTILYTVPLVLISRLLLGGGQESYLDQFAGYSPLIILSNIQHYLFNSIRGFWAGPSLRLGEYIFPILWLGALPLIVYGFVRRARRSTLVMELFFLFYLAIILIWPSVQELRFLYPILPLFLLYAGVGFEGVLLQVQKRISRPVMLGAAALAALAVLGIYAIRTTDVIQEADYVPVGPYTAAAQELFTFVSDETAPESIFVFFKPRALALYTGRHASTFPYNQEIEVAINYLHEIEADYTVLMKPTGQTAEDSPNGSLAALIEAQPEAFEAVYSNDGYEVYRVDLDALPESAAGS